MKDESTPSTSQLHRYWKESEDKYEPLDLFAKGMRIKADLCGAGINLGIEDDQKEPFDGHASHIILSSEQVGQVIETLSAMKKIWEDNFETWQEDVISKLMEDMMFAHSQPAVDRFENEIKQLVREARDNGNFDVSDAKKFLIEVIRQMPD